ncbi:MAG: hypothetical protein AAGJ82_09435 [Bacteroidota bacterium]
MELLGKLSLIIHIIAGIITLIAGPIAIFGQNRTRLHQVAGRAFYYAMLVVVVTSIIGFLKYPTATFYQFLLGIAITVGYHVVRGVRAILILKKRFRWGALDRYMAHLMLVTGTAMLAAGAWHSLQGSNIAFPILFTVFGIGALNDARMSFKLNKVADQLNARWLMRLHIMAMFAAFIASTTAFAVNVGAVMPWYIQWFAPTILLVPVQIYYLKKRGLTSKQLTLPAIA